MRLGVDFGTTHTVVALVDRGNYPVVGFEWGDTVPSQIAVRLSDGALRYGADAAALSSDPEWEVVRSLKRMLTSAGPLSELSAAGRTFLLSDLLEGYFRQLRQDIFSRSNASVRPGEVLELAVSVPANASNDQRFLTLDAFRRAGFEVVAMLNEPSAAGFEYAHRFRKTLTSRREYVLVYDLGGGTFDCSLIHMAGLVNEVITSSGVARLGGDDIDEAILDCVAERLGKAPRKKTRAYRALLEECRRQKEAVVANTRRLLVDLEGREEPVTVPIDEVYRACEPLVAQTLEVMDEVMRDPRREQDAVGWNEIAGIYVVGGASSFPLIYRHLRDRFGNHRVRRSPHPFAATAIGLANFLDEEAGYQLADCLTRHFGVWREAAQGREVSFDPIFMKDTRLPTRHEAPLEAVRRYRPAHNLGHFRYVECGRIRDGMPDNGVTPWDEIRFPFDPALRGEGDLARVPVRRLPTEGPVIEERYHCNATGIFEVTLACLDDGFSRTYRMARHAEAAR